MTSRTATSAKRMKSLTPKRFSMLALNLRSLASLRIKNIPQAVAHEVQAQQRDHQQNTGKSEHPPVTLHRRKLGDAFGGEGAPARQGRIHTDAEEAQERFLQNRRRHGERRVDSDRPDQIR